MYVYITNNKEGVKGAYYDESIANQVAEKIGCLVTKIEISGDFTGECSDLLAQAVDDTRLSTMSMNRLHNVPRHRALQIIEQLFYNLMQRFAKDIEKAKEYNKLIELMDKLYQEDSTADLVDIGEQISSELGYL